LDSLTLLTREIIYTRKPTEIFPGIKVTGEIPRIYQIEDTGGPFYHDALCSRPDDLPDDQALFIETPKGLVVLLGCGHSGVINTLEYVQELTDKKPIHAVLGGMHLLRATSERITFTGDRLNDMAIVYLAPNHCTGLDAVCYFKARFPDAFHLSQVGTIHRFSNS
jgi:7,8-dihydropterin-6-yl-methyl-4-(beta-D-ribofuranosyl)aminobenzene 5'-phosphate synthase